MNEKEILEQYHLGDFLVEYTPEEARIVALDWVNSVRRNLSLPEICDFPLGKRECPNACVVANCFRDMFHEDQYLVTTEAEVTFVTETENIFDEGRIFSHTEAVEQFIIYFDNECYPDLDLALAPSTTTTGA